MPRADALQQPSFLGGGSATHFLALAGPAVLPALRSVARVLFAPLMAVFAMRGRSLVSHAFRNSGLPVGFSRVSLSKSDGFKIAPSLGSCDNGVGFKSALFRKINGFVFNPLNRNHPGVPTVSLLVFATGPAAIFGRIWTVVINTINGVPLWPFSHILNEVVEGMKPAVTNLYPSTTITGVMFKVGVIAPPFHTLPDAVKWVRVFEGHFHSFITGGQRYHVTQPE